ncbi:MAG: peptidyl-prolyl cis-trans isomerase [Betaproteobacteria bacterium]|jgi:peptidyl-prolyl cis-trans isomerase A (cyclophilin A)|nr:MAG: peptidyl-prolyl cis-trans isomerase [Betaproteobacteria bacterium]
MSDSILSKCLNLIAPIALTVGAHAYAAEPAAPAPAAPTRVALETSEGRIVVELRADKAPKTVANFLQYVNDSFYDGTIFHRVIAGFMIQGGGFDAAMVEKPTRPPIPIESNNGLKNVRGAVAMARTGDPNSATAQFFINVVDNARLDYPSFDGHGYTVFGNVVEGMQVVDKIRAVPTGRRGSFENVPASPVVIKTARVAK